MRIRYVAALLGAALVAVTPVATAAPARADDIVCFINVIEPYKTGYEAIAPIAFGFQVHCTGRPALREVTTKLWRYDTMDGRHYVHAERTDNSTDPDIETMYYASCSTAGVVYRFHTDAIVNAVHGNWDRHPDDSDTMVARC
ncbi:hypothetical protein [Nocardia callitridis]|uniref:Secreted protein n=1 Tax=Nocardia callitridis TaxID=648753 RepID=A0ABP9K0U6_9NOCA